jgi:5-methyltetrahydropteroyltriglutamate--homocysteine methyltransferase
LIIANLGYAGIGELPEAIAALEAYRAGEIGRRGLEERLKAVRLARLLKQQEAGVDWIPVGDFTLSDRALDHAAAFGLAPEPKPVSIGEAGARGPAASGFAGADEPPEPAACRSKARYGIAQRHAAPTFTADAAPRLVRNPWAEAFLEARPHLAALPVPVMIGPYTFAKLAGGLPAEEALERLAPVYAEALRGLAAAGAEWAQLEEPELARPVPAEHWPLIGRVWRAMHDAAPQLSLMLQATSGVPDDIGRLLGLPAAGVGLDFTADGGRALQAVAKRGFPSDRVLGAGIVDGRSVWRCDLRAACELLENLRRLVPQVRLALQPTCSLAHAPSALRGGRAPHGLPRHALACADVKLGELRVLRDALAEGRDAVKLDLMDSDVIQDMLRVLLPAVPSDGGPAGNARTHARGPAGGKPPVAGASSRAQAAAGTA